MKIDYQGVLQVRAPRFLLAFQIQNFIKKNTTWIETHYKKFLQQQQDKKCYLFGDPISTPPVTSGHPPRGGGTIKVSLIEGGGGTVAKSEGVEEEKKQVEKFYKTQAKKYIIPRCQELAEKHGFHYNQIRITSAQTRWGSCSSKKTLSFSYRLVMTPKECIDYVIIHELCHLRQMNHSHKFWSGVAYIMPEYKKYEQHLKEFGWRYRV